MVAYAIIFAFLVFGLPTSRGRSLWKCFRTALKPCQVSPRLWLRRFSHGIRIRMALLKHWCRLAVFPCTPSSLSYPRSLACSRAHTTPSRRCRGSVHHAVKRLRAFRHFGREVRRFRWAFPARSLPQRTSHPRTSNRVGAAAGWRLHGRMRVLSPASSRPHFLTRCPSTVEHRSASFCFSNAHTSSSASRIRHASPVQCCLTTCSHHRSSA